MDFSIGSHHYHLSLLAIVVTCLVIIVLLPGSSSVSVDKWLPGGKEEIQTHGPWLRRVDSARHVIAITQAQAHKLADDTARLRQGLDAALAHAADLAAHSGGSQMELEIRRIGEACHRESVNCEARAAKWETAAHENQALADAAIGRANHADSVVKAGVAAATSCRLIHLGPIHAVKCPGPLTAFKIGVAGGIGIVEVLRALVAGHL